MKKPLQNERWQDTFQGAITICDTEGIIQDMNKFAIQQFSKYGGEQLIGSNLLNCHPEPARSKLKMMLEKQLKNVYITQSGDEKKLIIQAPLYNDGHYSGFVELSINYSEVIPVLKRDG